MVSNISALLSPVCGHWLCPRRTSVTSNFFSFHKLCFFYYMVNLIQNFSVGCHPRSFMFKIIRNCPHDFSNRKFNQFSFFLLLRFTMFTNMWFICLFFAQFRVWISWNYLDDLRTVLYRFTFPHKTVVFLLYFYPLSVRAHSQLVLNVIMHILFDTGVNSTFSFSIFLSTRLGSCR